MYIRLQPQASAFFTLYERHFLLTLYLASSSIFDRRGAGHVRMDAAWPYTLIGMGRWDRQQIAQRRKCSFLFHHSSSKLGDNHQDNHEKFNGNHLFYFYAEKSKAKGNDLFGEIVNVYNILSIDTLYFFITIILGIIVMKIQLQWDIFDEKSYGNDLFDRKCSFYREV